MYEEHPLETEVWRHLHSGEPDRITYARDLIAPLIKAAVHSRGMRPTGHLLLTASAAARAMAEAPMLSSQLARWAAQATGTSIEDLANGDTAGLMPVGSDIIAAACFREGHARLAAAKVLALAADDLVFVGHHLVALDDVQVGLGLLDTSLPAHSRLAGALRLVEAVTLSRLGNDPEPAFAAAEKMIAISARDLADEWHTEFSGANLAAHRVAVATDAKDYAAARLLCEATDFSGLSKERQVAVASDLASITGTQPPGGHDGPD